MKHGAKTVRMGKVGRRRLKRKVECKVKYKEKWALESSWRVSAKGFSRPLSEVCVFFCWHVPSLPLFYPSPVLNRAWLAFVGLGSPLKWQHIVRNTEVRFFGDVHQDLVQKFGMTWSEIKEYTDNIKRTM